MERIPILYDLNKINNNMKKEYLQPQTSVVDYRLAEDCMDSADPISTSEPNQQGDVKGKAAWDDQENW